VLIATEAASPWNGRIGGLARSQQELERVATGLVEELELRHTRPIDPDLLAVFLDGKYVEFRDGDRLRSATIYVVLGLP
jgi:transposase-like protein